MWKVAPENKNLTFGLQEREDEWVLYENLWYNCKQVHVAIDNEW